MHSTKLVRVDAKNLSLFTQNFVWNGVSLLLASKTQRKWLKNCKNQIMLEKRKYTYFAVWGLKPKQSFLVFTWFMVTFNLKMISIKSVFNSNLTFINP